MCRLLWAVLVIPGMAMAGPYDGVFKQTSASDCLKIGQESGALEIRDGIFYGVEVECRMTRPVNVVDMDATLYTMQCSGEDQTWSERAMLMTPADGDGLIMVWNGYAFRYDRCSDSNTETSAR
jgi:hypothetical protein